METGMQGDIVLIGRVGEKTALEVVNTHKSELLKRYSASYLRRGVEGLSISFIDDDTLNEAFSMCGYLYPLREESVQMALWSIGTELQTGLLVQVPAIPISQFTIEMAEYTDENPYKTDSTGCILCVTCGSDALCSFLAERGVVCACIGHLTDDNDRCLINGEIKSFLTGRDSEI